MSQVVAITGMHRSGTSLVSNLLQKAGVHIGDQLLAANSANPRGFFEDVDFYEFQEHLLHARGQSYLCLDGELNFQPTPAELERAQQLIEKRSHHQLWGWKDPRTALFLDFWRQQLPQARFLFVYRHPLDVLLSLLRRGEFDEHPLLLAGMDAWLRYNASILAFYDCHAAQCLLVHIDGVVDDTKQFVQLLAQKLQLDIRLDSDTFDQIYDAKELRRTPPVSQVEDIFARLSPVSLELYHQLNARASLPADQCPSDSSASPPTMSALAQFTASLSKTDSLPVKHSLLQLLLSLLAPERAATMQCRFYQRAKGAQQRIDEIWMHAQRLERMNGEQVEAQQQQQAQLIALQTQLHEQGLQLQSQYAELNRVYKTQIGKLLRSYWRLKARWQEKVP